MITRATWLGQVPLSVSRHVIVDTAHRNDLEEAAGEGHPQSFRLLREQPRVADVAVHRGLEVDQHETHVVHPAAEVFAGQAVRELVGRSDEEDGDHREQHGVERWSRPKSPVMSPQPVRVMIAARAIRVPAKLTK